MATVNYIRLGFFEGEILSLLEQGPEAVMAAYHKFDAVYKDSAVVAACWQLVAKCAANQKPWSNTYDIYAQFEGDTRRWQQDVDAINQAAAEMGACDACLPEDWYELAVDVFYGLHAEEDVERVAQRWDERHGYD